MAAVTPPSQQRATAHTWPLAARGGPPLAAPPPPRLFPLRRSREGGGGDGGGSGGCPARPVGVTGRRALRRVGASSFWAEQSGGRGRSPRGRRRAEAAAAAASRAARGRERGAPAAPPAPGPADLVGPSHGHGGQREAEAGGEAPEDAAGHDGAAAQPQVLRLRPARPHLREHDGRLLRVHLLLRQPERIKSTSQGEIYLHDNIYTTGN